MSEAKMFEPTASGVKRQRRRRSGEFIVKEAFSALEG